MRTSTERQRRLARIRIMPGECKPGSRDSGAGVRRTAGWILAAGLLLSGAALYNGYPLLFYDSEMYVHPVSSVIRPSFYSLLLCPMHLGRSLWLVVFWQSVIVSHLLHLTTRTTFPGLSGRHHLLVVLVLTLVSTAPWMTGYIMPDVFAAVLVLSAYLLVFRSAALNRAERIYLHVLFVASVIVHASNLPLAVGLLVVAAVVRFAGRALTGPTPGRLAPVALSVVAAAGLVLANNALVHGRLSLSPTGYAFVLARFLEDGPGIAFLRSSRPPDRYALARYVDEFPMNSNAFLWGHASPFRKVGGFEGYEEEGKEIVIGTLRQYPLWTLQTMVVNVARQLTRLHLGAAFLPLAQYDWMVERMSTYFPEEVDAFRDSRQNHAALGLDAFKWVHFGALVLAAAAAAGALVRLWKRRIPAPLLLFVAIAAGILASAAITGPLSEPSPRYLGRVIWLLPYFACVAWVYLASRRGQGPEVRRT